MRHPDLLHLLLTHGSYALLFGALVAGGLGLPLPEDLVLLTAGVLSHQGLLRLPVALVLCFAGVLCGDLLLFHTARKLGPSIYEHRSLRRLLNAERRRRITRLYERHGSRVVFIGRYMSVLRVPIFIMAALHGMPVRRFLLWDALALCISVPVVVGFGYLFSQSIERVAGDFRRTEHLLVLMALLVATLAFLAARMRARQRMRG